MNVPPLLEYHERVSEGDWLAEKGVMGDTGETGEEEVGELETTLPLPRMLEAVEVVAKDFQSSLPVTNNKMVRTT
jgi:hypothetical protein